MNTERIKEIQLTTGYPDSVAVQQALLQVWNEVVQESNQLEPPTNNDCEHLYISEFDYYTVGNKKYYHIKVINETEKFIEFEWAGSGTKQLMPLKTFNEVFTIEEKLQVAMSGDSYESHKF